MGRWGPGPHYCTCVPGCHPTPEPDPAQATAGRGCLLSLSLCSLRAPGSFFEYLPEPSHPALAFAFPGHHPARGAGQAGPHQVQGQPWGQRIIPTEPHSTKPDNVNFLSSLSRFLIQLLSNMMVSEPLCTLKKY